MHLDLQIREMKFSASLIRFDTNILGNILHILFNEVDSDGESVHNDIHIERLLQCGNKNLSSKMATIFRKQIQLSTSISKSQFFPLMIKHCKYICFNACDNARFNQHMFVHLHHIEKLDFVRAHYVENCLANLATLSNLKKLMIDMCFPLSDYINSDIVLPSLESMYIETCKDLPYFGFAPNLIKLKIWFEHSSDETFEPTYVFQSMPKLKILKIFGRERCRGLIIPCAKLDKFVLWCRFTVDPNYMFCFSETTNLSINGETGWSNIGKRQFMERLASVNNGHMKTLYLRLFAESATQCLKHFSNLTSLILSQTDIDCKNIYQLPLVQLRLGGGIKNIKLISKIESLELLAVVNIYNDDGKNDSKTIFKLPPNLKILIYSEPWNYNDIECTPLDISRDVTISANGLRSVQQIYYGCFYGDNFLKGLGKLLKNKQFNLCKVTLYCEQDESLDKILKKLPQDKISFKFNYEDEFDSETVGVVKGQIVY
jgi:hypothetical protein